MISPTVALLFVFLLSCISSTFFHISFFSFLLGHFLCCSPQRTHRLSQEYPPSALRHQRLGWPLSGTPVSPQICLNVIYAPPGSCRAAAVDSSSDLGNFSCTGLPRLSATRGKQTCTLGIRYRQIGHRSPRISLRGPPPFLNRLSARLLLGFLFASTLIASRIGT
ncbi:hypothetical protein L209DRAFT_29330 [Thermothelomyces heterothallicus CBS 203.75]